MVFARTRASHGRCHPLSIQPMDSKSRTASAHPRHHQPVPRTLAQPHMGVDFQRPLHVHAKNFGVSELTTSGIKPAAPCIRASVRCCVYRVSTSCADLRWRLPICLQPLLWHFAFDPAIRGSTRLTPHPPERPGTTRWYTGVNRFKLSINVHVLASRICLPTLELGVSLCSLGSLVQLARVVDAPSNSNTCQ